MTELNLTGKVAIVTGSSRGLGRHYAMKMAEAGADVVIHDKSEKSAAEFGEASSGYAVAEEVRGMGRRSEFYAADLTDAEQVSQFVQKVVEKLGRIDILVNNAGGDIGKNTPFPNPNTALDIKDEDIQVVVERNLLTTMYMCKYVGRQMREQKSGKIINIGSSAANVPVSSGLVYAAAKAGIQHYTRCLAEELRPYDVNVNSLAPAATTTGRFMATLADRPVPSQEGLSRLQRFAQLDDMAGIVMFLAGPGSDRLTGETVVCI